MKGPGRDDRSISAVFRTGPGTSYSWRKGSMIFEDELKVSFPAQVVCSWPTDSVAKLFPILMQWSLESRQRIFSLGKS